MEPTIISPKPPLGAFFFLHSRGTSLFLMSSSPVCLAHQSRLRRSRKGDNMKKAKKENYRIVTESGKQLFNQTYTEAGANRIWEMYNGVYTDDNGNEEYIYVEKI